MNRSTDNAANTEDAILPLLDNGIGPAAGQATPAMTRRRVYISATLLVLLGIIMVVSQLLDANQRRTDVQRDEKYASVLSTLDVPAPGGAAAGDSLDVIALGRLRPEDDVVTVAAPYGAGDARVAELLVAEGDVVIEGELLAVLDSMSRYVSALSAAETALATSKARLRQMIVQVDAQEAETRARLDSAIASSVAAEASLQRTRSLFQRNLVSREALDSAESAAAVAAGDVETLTATLSRYAGGSSEIQVDIAVASADVVAAEVALEQAHRDLDLARVYAPLDGTILSIDVRVGERTPQNGLMRMGYVEQMEAAVEVFQSSALRVQPGQRVTIASDILGEAPLVGTVSRVGSVVGRQSITGEDPAAHTDARVIEVIVRLDRESSGRAARLVGLEIVARIETAGYENLLGGTL